MEKYLVDQFCRYCKTKLRYLKSVDDFEPHELKVRKHYYKCDHCPRNWTIKEFDGCLERKGEL